MARPENEGKAELKKILIERLLDHIRNRKIPHISIFIADNIELALEYGYTAVEQFLYDNQEFSSLLKTGKHKRVSHIYQGILEGKIPPAAGIFALKQDGYTDKQTVDMNTTIKADDEKAIKDMSTEDLMEIIRKKANV